MQAPTVNVQNTPPVNSVQQPAQPQQSEQPHQQAQPAPLTQYQPVTRQVGMSMSEVLLAQNSSRFKFKK